MTLQNFVHSSEKNDSVRNRATVFPQRLFHLKGKRGPTVRRREAGHLHRRRDLAPEPGGTQRNASHLMGPMADLKRTLTSLTARGRHNSNLYAPRIAAHLMGEFQDYTDRCTESHRKVMTAPPPRSKANEGLDYTRRCTTHTSDNLRASNAGVLQFVPSRFLQHVNGPGGTILGHV